MLVVTAARVGVGGMGHCMMMRGQRIEGGGEGRAGVWGRGGVNKRRGDGKITWKRA